MAKTPQQELFKRVNQAKPDELKNILIKLGALNPQMAQLILAIFNNEPVELEVNGERHVQDDFETESDLISDLPQIDQSEVDKELQHIRGVISNEIRIGNQEGWSYQETARLTSFFSDLLSEIVDDTGEIHVPFQIGFPIVLTVIKNQMKVFAEYKSDKQMMGDSILEAFDALTDLVNQTAPHLNTKLRDKYLDQALKIFSSNAFQGHDSLRYEFIDSVLLLVTKDHTDKVVDASAKLVKKADFWDDGDHKRKHILLRMHVALATGQMGIAKEIATANMDNDDVRHQWIGILLSQEKYQEAEKIALDAPRDYSNDRETWDDVLTTIYERSNQTEKLISLLKQRILSHQTSVYELYKGMLMDRHEWKKVYPEFLKQMEQKLTRYEFGDILVKEKESAKLFEQVKKYNSAPMFRKYLPNVYKAQKDEVTTLYHEMVIKSDSQKTTAGAPKQLQKDLENFLNVSNDGKTVQEWLNELKRQLRRQPKFLDSLSDVQYQVDQLKH